ncbi:DUF2062 domain-containing protein [Cystobacter fuscus]|nr:DUF2062 domain-containing protein [Cystobacter fuscus]
MWRRRRRSACGKWCTVSSWWKQVKRKLRRARVRLLRSAGQPEQIAGGMALGLFVAMLPLLGLQLPLVVLVAELLRRLAHIHVSRVAALAGVWLTNPLTAAPLYGLCYVVGRPLAHYLLPVSFRSTNTESAALDLSALSFSGPDALEVVLGLVLGSLMLGVPTAWLGYRITYGMVSRQRALREQRRARRTRAPGLVAGT